MKGLTVKKFFGYGAMVVVSVIVLAFLGLHSLTFFEFTFPDSQSFYAYLGFGLTSGGVVAYLVMLVTVSDTPLKKGIAITMLSISIIGELLTAGFGMQVEAWKTAGFSLTEKDFSFMILCVQILSLFHGLALIGHFAGDAIAQAFADDDKDGIPNVFDKDSKKPTGFRPFPSQTQDADIGALLAQQNKIIADLRRELAEAKNPQTGQEPK